VSTATELTEITLQRETILLSPVYSAVIHHVAPNGQEIQTGYVRLSAFSQVCVSSMGTCLFHDIHVCLFKSTAEAQIGT
jgi:hypothetical protein